MLLMTTSGSALVAAQSPPSSTERTVASAERSDADRERDRTSKPVAVLGFFGVQAGVRVLDLLSGGGYYSEILSLAVGPEGKEPAQSLHRIDEKFARKDIESAGFSFAGESNALRNPDDDRTQLVFDERIRGRTDRFVYRFVKAGPSE